MAASGRTARRLLQFWKTTDAPTFGSWSEALANQLDNDVEIHQGKLSERPAAALSGRMYFVQGDATAANNGILWIDNGTTWVEVGNAAPWTALSLGAKVEDVGALQSVRARTESGGATARLRGGLTVKSGQEIATGGEIATLPAGVRPPAKVAVVTQQTGTFIGLEISAAGVITLGSAASIPAGHTVTLDGLTFNLT